MASATNNVDPIVSDAAYFLLPTLTTELRNMAKAATWPEEIVNQLSIDFDGDSIFISYPDSIASKVIGLEYGHGSDRPNSVIRAFTYRVEPMIKKTIGARIVENVIDEEGVFNV